LASIVECLAPDCTNPRPRANGDVTRNAARPPPRPAPARRRIALVGAAARRDFPDGLDRRPAHDPHAVVEVEGGIAVRREELDALAQARGARGIGERQPAVLVAGETVLHAGP